jgi:hypothetical protein
MKTVTSYILIGTSADAAIVENGRDVEGASSGPGNRGLRTMLVGGFGRYGLLIVESAGKSFLTSRRSIGSTSPGGRRSAEEST